jgi:RNA polymerase sigma-70 factor (ECF subfamily)
VTSAIHPVASLAPAAPFSAMERGRVLGLCVRLTGDPDAAEDLSQETLIEAWRSEHRLRDPSKRWAWLAGIARNVCRRWARSRGREVARTARLAPAAGTSADGEPDHHVAALAEELADERFDVEVEFERSELTVILDRAMALLPAATRELLVARVVEDKPPRELAERLGVGEGVVAVRLQRAKGRLRRCRRCGSSTPPSSRARSTPRSGTASARWGSSRRSPTGPCR